MNTSYTSTIFISDDYPAWSLAMLRSEFPKHQIIQGSTSDLVSGKINGESVEALLVRSTSLINSTLLKRMPKLRVVGTATSGFDHFDLPTLSNKNILAFHTPDANARSTADLTLWHILSCLRHLTPKSISAIQWRSSLQRGKEAKGLSLGILGMGRIGQAVTQSALGLNMQVFYHDPYVDQEVIKQKYHTVEALGLLELFTQCDLISLHLPLTKKTKHIINEKTLEHFGSDKMLINCARGELIHTPSLLKALDSGTLSFVALDTFESEPLEDLSPIRNHPRISWTPHIGAYTEQAFNNSCREAVESLISLLKHNIMPQALLPPALPWAKDL